MLLRLPAVLFLLLASSCGTEGALGQVDVAPECAPSDLTCAADGLSAPLAAGTSLPLRLALTLEGSSAPSMQLASADPAVFEVAGTEVLARSSGVAALLILDEAGAGVLDFLHVWVEEPDRLVVHRVSPDGYDFGDVTGTLELLPGDETLLTAQPHAGAQPLLGGAGTSWEVEGDAVTLLRDGVPSRARLVAREAGRAHVTVRFLELEQTMTVEVIQ